MTLVSVGGTGSGFAGLERMADKFRVIVLDDRRLVRESLVMVLKAVRERIDIQDVAHLSSALDKIGKPESDTVLLVMSHTEKKDLQLISELLESAPDVPIVLITTNENPWYIAGTLQKGARGVVLASSGGAEVVQILRLVASGGTYAPASALLSACAVEGPSDRSIREPNATDFLKLFPELSSKQIIVLNLISRGLSNQEIAAEIPMRNPAVKAHVHHLMRKLGVRNRTEAALLTRRRIHGLRGS